MDVPRSVQVLLGATASASASVAASETTTSLSSAFRPKTVEVPTITLDDLLDRSGVKKIDFLSMDIEGAEPLALAGFDIERFHPALVCIEVNLPVREEIHAYFLSHGYERIDAYKKHDRVNWYYRPKAKPSGESEH